jgi:hypothetical protein
MLAHYFQIEEGKVEVKTVTDPRAALIGNRDCDFGPQKSGHEGAVSNAVTTA